MSIILTNAHLINTSNETIQFGTNQNIGPLQAINVNGDLTMAALTNINLFSPALSESAIERVTINNFNFTEYSFNSAIPITKLTIEGA